MKTSKAVENVEITPSKKKLTQARLPFKLISEDASTPVAPPTRKRKLSADGTEPAPKGKICKENNEVDDLVVISDDECKDSQKVEKEVKAMNPFVKLVDTAWKKKLQKAKSPKKRRSRKSTPKQKKSIENKSATDQGDTEDVEMMDVDAESQEQTENKRKSPKKSPTSKTKEIVKNNKCDQDQDDVVVLQDSNHSSDVQKPDETQKQESDNDCTETKEEKQESGNDHTETKEEKQESDNDITEANTETASVTPRSTRKSKTDAEKSNESSKPAPKTPVRKAKSDSKDKANTSLPNAKLNESLSSPVTPKRNSRSSSVTNSLNDSISESSTPANLTPKQLQKKLESAKKREEREKEKQDREKKRQEEKDEKAKQRQEKEDARKKEREEKEEQKRKEREEKEKQKELEKKLREEKEEQKRKEREEKEEQKRKEKEEKEEQKRKEKEAKEEEKRKKQEALEIEKQEQELKKKKAAEAFVNFFVPKKEKEQPKAVVSQNSILSSFTIKVDMRLAPLVRVEMSDSRKKDMEKVMSDQKLGEKDLYLKSLKKESVKIGCSGKTWPLSDKDDDVMIIEDELPPIEGADEVLACEPAARERLRPKLFSFHENRRPPYWGTWRKTSAFVTARRPFGQEKQVDYDVDSDEDWEEEQEGESLDGSVAGDDDEPDDDYEVDNEVFVPHGYLSDEEATMDEEEDKDNVLSLSPETQKARLKNLEDEFETEMKKPTEKLKPRLYGLIWETQDGGKPEKCIDALWNYFGKLAMIMDDTAIDSLLQPPTESQEPEKKKVKKKKVLAEGEQQSPKSDKKKKVKPESKETKKAKPEVKQETKKNQPGINSFLTKLKST